MLRDEVIRTAAELSQDVYSQQIRTGRLVTVSNAAFSCLERGGCLYICFRGSNDRLDWGENFDTQLIQFYGGAAHDGFVQHWEKLSSKVFQLCGESKCLRIVLCGHSLGGAVAVLAALSLLRAEYPANRLQLCTFGAPRAVDTTNATAIRCKSLRVVNYGDPIPLTPLSVLPRWIGGCDSGFYQHHNSATWFLMPGGRIATERNSLAYRILLTLWRMLRCQSTISKNHTMDEYVNRLRLTPVWRQKAND